MGEVAQLAEREKGPFQNFVLWGPNGRGLSHYKSEAAGSIPVFSPMC